MSNKNIVKHVKCFLMDHLWVILLFIAAPVSMMVCYLTAVSDKFEGSCWYYVFLSVFLLFCFLGYRFYATWDFYEILCKESSTMEDFLIREPKSREENHYREMAKKQHQLYINRLISMEDQRKQNKIMIYRWVHQLKTPLSVIRLIAEENKNNCDFRKTAQAAAQIQYDLDQILNMYKLDAIRNDFHSEQVNLHRVCKECINELKSSFITKEIFPKLVAADDLVVYSDSKWLRFVLYQLLTNAIKYSDEGNRVTVKAGISDTGTFLSIEDEGCGIEVRDLHRIFDLFFTGQNGRMRGESSGLGLYMVKQILDYLGHHIEVKSELGKGSTFTILF